MTRALIAAGQILALRVRRSARLDGERRRWLMTLLDRTLRQEDEVAHRIAFVNFVFERIYFQEELVIYISRERAPSTWQNTAAVVMTASTTRMEAVVLNRARNTHFAASSIAAADGHDAGIFVSGMQL